MEKRFGENFALDEPNFGSGARTSQKGTPSQKFPNVCRLFFPAPSSYQQVNPLVKNVKSAGLHNNLTLRQKKNKKKLKKTIDNILIQMYNKYVR